MTGENTYRSPNGKSSRCRECDRQRQRARYKADSRKRNSSWRHSIKVKYGITAEEYYERLEAQGGGCAICGRKYTERRLAVDHCHQTGRVRGLLCAPCNSFLGRIQDNHTTLVQYLDG